VLKLRAVFSTVAGTYHQLKVSTKPRQ